MSFWFGDFELDPERRQLLRFGQPVPLEPKAYELPSLLLEREAEVEALWEKIRRRRLAAVIGPSGVGKTSFLRRA